MNHHFASWNLEIMILSVLPFDFREVMLKKIEDWGLVMGRFWFFQEPVSIKLVALVVQDRWEKKNPKNHMYNIV